MNGGTFSIKARKECSKSKKFVATFLKGNPLPEEMFLDISFFVLRRFWGASIEKASPFKLL